MEIDLNYRIAHDNHQPQLIHKIINLYAPEKIREKKPPQKKGAVTRKNLCPNDQTELQPLIMESVEIQYCPHCFGIWFDFGELESLFEKKLKQEDLARLHVQNHILQIKEDDHRPNKVCPNCLNILTKSSHPDLTFSIDHCTQCGGIWLDGNEFAQLYEKVSEKTKGRDLIKQIINHYIDIRI